MTGYEGISDGVLVPGHEGIRVRCTRVLVTGYEAIRVRGMRVFVPGHEGIRAGARGY